MYPLWDHRMSIIALSAFQDNYIWAIVNPDTKTMTCVDPGDAEPVLSYATKQGLKLTNILITHHHDDHLAGVPALLQHAPDCHVYGPEEQRILPFCSMIDCNKMIVIEDNRFHVLNCPGHTRSHVCYYEPKKRWLFCGDTLFSAGCGRVFDGTIEQLYQSLQLIKNLPSRTELYCGHEYTRKNLRFAAQIEPNNAEIKAYALWLGAHPNQCSLPTTVAQEKKINPFFHTDATALHAFANTHGINPLNELAVFKQLRSEKDRFN